MLILALIAAQLHLEQKSTQSGALARATLLQYEIDAALLQI